MRWVLAATLPVIMTVAFGKWRGMNPRILWYRASTSLRAMTAIYTLPEQDVRDFLASYELFEQERVSGKNDFENTVNYYKVLNHLCAVGEVEKMYIPPVVDPNLNIFDNQLLWEEAMADSLDLTPGSRVLDLGCGRGRVAHHVASYSGARVTGINIDSTQIRMAQDYANITGLLGSQLSFVHGNFNDPLPFPDETFDALYQVQVLTYTVDPLKLFREMYRILKPGAKIAFLDWVQLPGFNSTDKLHLELLKKVKPLLGAVWTPKPSDFTVPLREAGFQVLSSQEASITGGQYQLIQKAQSFFETAGTLLRVLAKIRLIPRHFVTLWDRLTQDGEAFVEADKLGLFTTSWQIIAQKPGIATEDKLQIVQPN
ncbi:ERG6 [Symbiodinium pilosum]|uniref:ERG6 protein n=1 Tax=Symbiodinium pilosum TaxID=2952 RepID=A0A812X2H3_SYMPI|nr:ERG6 [Symbiodinium pilosum]